jgi:hypothetical protein
MPGRVLIATSDNAPESDKRIASAPIPSAQAAGGAVESAEEPVDLAEMSPLATDNIATTEARWRTGDEPFPENTVEDTVVLIAEDAVGIKPAEKPESDFYLMESKPSPVKNKPVLKETAKQAAAPTVEDKKEESEKKVATVDEGDSEITAAEKKPAPKSNEKAPISRFFDNIFGAKNKVENENKNEKSTLFNTDTYND